MLRKKIKTKLYWAKFRDVHWNTDLACQESRLQKLWGKKKKKGHLGANRILFWA